MIQIKILKIKTFYIQLKNKQIIFKYPFLGLKLVQYSLIYFKSYLLSESTSTSIISSLTVLFLGLIDFTSGSITSALTSLSSGSSGFTSDSIISSLTSLSSGSSGFTSDSII